MPRARRVSLVPTTPGGINLRTADLSVDEIVIDDEVVIKSSVFRGVPREESEAIKSTLTQIAKSPKRTPKYIVRKSTDLRKIKNIDDRIDAILASPMIENRRRPLGLSKSLNASDNERTPLRVPSSQDLQAISSRRMSAIVMSKFASYLHSTSFTEGENKYLCSTKLNRRKTTGNFATPAHSLRLSLGTPLHKNTPVTPGSKDASVLDQELVDLDRDEDVENLPPPPSQEALTQEPSPSTSQPQIASEVFLMASVDNEPRSVGEFRVLVNMEISRLSALKAAWEDVMEEEGSSIPEAAITHIRAAVGKCGLLIKNRLQTFFSLIDYTEESLRKQEQGDINELTYHQRSNINDLLGMWTNIARQISDIDKSFDRLRRWRDVSKWAYSSPPATPAPPPKRQQKSTSRMPRPAWKSKASLKRLIPPASNTIRSKLRPSYIVKRSNLAHIKAQMLAKKRALDASGNTDEIVIFGSGKNEGLHISVGRGTPSKAASTLVSVEGRVLGSSGRRGRPRRSESIQLEETLRTEGHVGLSPPVHESSHHQIDLDAAERAPKAGEGIAVHENPDGEGGDVIEESVEIQSPRSRGRPRRSTTLGISPIESELVHEEGGNLQSSKSGPGRLRRSIGTSKSPVMLGGVDFDVFAEGLSPRNVSSLIVEGGSAPEKAVESLKSCGRSRKSSSFILRVEESVSLQSSDRGKPSKFITSPESSMAQGLSEENNELQSQKWRTPKVNNTDPDESFGNFQSPKPRGRPRKSSSVLEHEPAELNVGLQPSILCNVSSNTVQEESDEIQSSKHSRSSKSTAAEYFYVNSELSQENSELRSLKRGRPRKSTEQTAEVNIQTAESSSAFEVINFEPDEIPDEQSIAIEAVSSHQNAAAKQSELVKEQQQLQSPEGGRPRTSTAKPPAVPETPLQVIDVNESAVLRRSGGLSRSSLFVPDSQFPATEEVTTLQSSKPRGRQQSMVINDSLDQSAVSPTPKKRVPTKLVIVDDSILTAERTPKVGRPRRSAMEAVESITPVVASAKQHGRPRKSVVNDSSVANRSVFKQTPKRGRPRKSMTVESVFRTPGEVVGTISVVSSTKFGRPGKSVAMVQDTPSAAAESASRKRGRPSRPSETTISGNPAGGNFLIPDSLPRKRPQMDLSSLLSTSHVSTVANTTDPFSPPPRPITGTPRPHMSKLIRTKVDSSLTQSVLRKQLMLATTCGGNNSGRSSTAAAAGLFQPNSDKRPVGRPRKSVRFLGSPVSQSSSTEPCLPVTPHVRSSTDPSRRVSLRSRRPHHTP